MREGTNRAEWKERLCKKADSGEPVIFAAAGTGLSAKMYDISGVDGIVATGIGDFVQNGYPSAIGYMFYGDANALNQKVIGEVLVRAGEAPVIAGVGATDPFRNLRFMLEDLQKNGVKGIVNMPSVCVYDDLRRAQLQSGQFGYEEEAQMLELASEMGFFTVANVANAKDAERMCRAGADVLVVTCGFTVGGLSGTNAVTAMSMEDMIQNVREVLEVARTKGNQTLVLATGGLLNTVEAVQKLFEETGVHGFLGGSVFERLPIERAVTSTVKEYLTLSTNP